MSIGGVVVLAVLLVFLYLLIDRQVHRVIGPEGKHTLRVTTTHRWLGFDYVRLYQDDPGERDRFLIDGLVPNGKDVYDWIEWVDVSTIQVTVERSAAQGRHTVVQTIVLH